MGCFTGEGTGGVCGWWAVLWLLATQAALLDVHNLACPKTLRAAMHPESILQTTLTTEVVCYQGRGVKDALGSTWRGRITS